MMLFLTLRFRGEIDLTFSVAAEMISILFTKHKTQIFSVLVSYHSKALHKIYPA